MGETSGRWITCKEAFPPLYEDVLVQLSKARENIITVGFWTGRRFCCGIGYPTILCEPDVTAWMPLPEPYKEQE